MTTDGRGGDAICPICREARPVAGLLPGDVLNDAALDILHAEYPEWSREQPVCTSCLHQALAVAAENTTTPDPPTPYPAHEEMQRRRTLGERVSDQVAGFVGSWSFLSTQVILLFIWIAFNTVAIFRWHFDPYPYILLNLVLSWIAALQAPLILMSQNRQDARDRLRDEGEYHTNLVAEREIRQLHAKLDHLIQEHSALLRDIHRQQREMTERFSAPERPDHD